MKKPSESEQRVAQTMRGIQRTWLMWGLLPLAACTLLMLTVGAVWASPIEADEHNIERGFQAVLALCAALFLTGFWLDGNWTHSERIATRIHALAGGESFTPNRSGLAAHADVAFRSITSSTTALTFIGGAIAVSAVISAFAGLDMGQGLQLILLGLFYQLFVFSRHPYYEELLTAAAHGELVVADDDDNHAAM